MQVRALFAVLALASAACGGKEPPAAAPTTPAPSASAPSQDDNRKLTREECESLAGWMVSACEKRGNVHSSKIDRWCSDISRKTSSEGSWLTDTCLPHIRYMDAACIQSTESIQNMMDCETNISHGQ